MAKLSKASKSSDKKMAKLKTEEIKQIGKQVKKDIYKNIKYWLAIIILIFGGGLWYIYTNAIEQLKNLLVNRISEEFKQPMIRKTIEDVAANNAKQIFIAEIQPEVTKFKTDIRNEMDKFEKSVTERVDKIAKNKQSELTKEYPNGYTVLGLSSEHGVIIPKDYVPEGVKIDLSSTKIDKITKDTISIIFPEITFQHSNFKNTTITFAKKVGSKVRIIKTPEWLLYAEILAIEKDLTIIAVGFEQEKLTPK